MFQTFKSKHHFLYILMSNNFGYVIFKKTKKIHGHRALIVGK